MRRDDMKVMQWNFFSESDQQSGIKRYEDEIYDSTKKLINVERVRRKRRSYLTDVLNFKKNEADVVHATFQMLAPLKIIKMVSNFILTVHDIIPTIYFNWVRKFRNLWFLSEWAIPFADKIITDSVFTKKELIHYLRVDEDKICVIPLGVDKKYQPLDKVACRKRFNLDHEMKYILLVSSNEKWKNMELVNKIVNKIDEYKFIKIGYGELLDNPKIIDLGYIDEKDMPYLYNACDLFLHPSFYEGFGLPPLEAMACGCPVISSNAASLPEVIGDAGILTNLYDINEWTDAISEVLTSEGLRQDLIKKGLKQSKKFTWEKTARETIKIYEDAFISGGSYDEEYK
jgi:glycosyltransferase involved in cell wall biosynthesis